MEETTRLAEMLMCPVCHDILADPRQLPCGHSMCMDCVEKLLDHSSEAPLRCPDCRTDFGLLVGLQRSYTLSSIAEDFRLNQKTRENQRRKVYCDYCPDRTTLANKTCLKCEVSLCQEHLKDHLQLPAFTGHPLVKPLGDLTERKCHQHEDEVLRYYCTSSRRYICNICALESKQLNATTEAFSVLRRQLTEYMDQHFEVLQGQAAEFTASLRKLQDDIQHKKLWRNPTDPHLNGVTLVLLFLWFIALYYAYNFSVENQILTEALKKQKHRTPVLPAEEGTMTLDLDTTSHSIGFSCHQAESVKPNTDCLQTKSCNDDDPQVLSSQCFSSGIHVWEVEAEGQWDIVVFHKSVQGKSNGNSAFGSNLESWRLSHNGKDSLSASHKDIKTPLTATLNSSRIAVVVNFEEGRIAFSAVDFTTTQLHEFKVELPQPVCLNVGVHVGDGHSRGAIVKTA